MSKHAMLLGCNGPSGIPRLDYAESDIEILKTVLTSERCGFSVQIYVPDQSVHEIHSKLLETASKCDADDSLLIYFAGHGALERGKLYLLWSRTDIDLIPFTSIHSQWLLEVMELCQARHKLLIFDCCHAGAAKGGRTYDQMRVEELFDARSNQLIFASDRFERAREFEEYRGSFLAHGIAEALRNRLDTSISASYLVDSLRRKAFEHNRLPQPPVPIPFIFGQHSGDFVLASAMGSEDAAVSLVPSASPQTTLAAAPSGEILVGAGEDCQFASLADALVECVPQSRLVLRAGVYQGNVHVDIPIEIHAAEGNDKVELRGSIHISGDCHFRGVTIRNDSAHVVTVDRGTVSFLDCKIYGGESHACMKALTHSRLKLRNVCFEGGAFGLIVAFHAHAVVDTCEFALHGVGIIVDRGAEITVNSSILRDCNKIGIDVRNRGRAVIQKVIVDNNRDIGVEATGNSNANIGNSTIRRNGQGVRFEDNSTGEVIGNEITENTMSGIHVATNSSPTVRENSIRNNASDGVIVFSNGRGLYEKNKISNNGAHGFDIQGGSHIRIRRNHIFENQGAGLRASEESQVEAESDEIYLNSNNGIDAQEGARVALSSCIVNNNRGCGILADSSNISISDSEVSASELSGVELVGGVLSSRDSKFQDNHTNGVWTKERGEASLLDCEILRNDLFGVFVQADCSLSDCRVSESGQDGVNFQDGGKGEVRGCRLSRNAWGGAFVDEGTDPKLENNLLEGNRGGGIRIGGRGGGVVDGNIIRDNEPGQILVTMPLEELSTQFLNTTGDALSIEWSVPDNESE